MPRTQTRPRIRARAIAIAATAMLLAAPLVTLTPAPAAEAHSIKRIAGANRYATSVAMSQALPWVGETVYLASGAKFPDALAAGPVAAAEQAHLLLTTRDAVPPTVMQEIERISPDTVVLVGDQQSISSSVARAIETEIGATVERVSGSNRFETALALLDRVEGLDEIWVVAGGKFPDALVAGSVAGQSNGGIILDWRGTTPAQLEAWRQRVAPYVEGRPVRVAGSTASVSAATVEALRRSGATSVERYAGSDRYETAVRIHDAFSRTAPNGRMLLTTGQNFPDALGGSVLAAATGQPLYLTPTRCHTPTATMLRAERDQRGVSVITGLGGKPSLSDPALRLENCPPPPPRPTPPPPAPSIPPGPAPSSSVNCSDFRTQRAAQLWFDYWFPRYGDIAGLDRDDDGRACETLP
ncbi:cell wall-binding repeat-containing protein [Agrococcus sp. Marseille-P2731]|uniref:cell wall-binding repeat-containing protein n=1 Tax=Agrococcus sp. Marseille-P2731 TaxID=1841862 RepID=UPI000931BBAB|nr:cell wall-binding repeat-containing protein [Agrococcus sp. Marseille-P2731]